MKKRGGKQKKCAPANKLLHAEMSPSWKPKVNFSNQERLAYNNLIRTDFVAVNCLVNRHSRTSVVCTTGLSGLGHPELCVRGFPLDSLEMAKHAVVTLARRFHLNKQSCKIFECVVTSPGLLWTTIGLVPYDDARVVAEMADAYYCAPVLALEYSLIGLWATVNYVRLKFDFPLCHGRAVENEDDQHKSFDESLVPARLWSHVACRLEPIAPSLNISYIDGKIVTQHGIIYDIVRDMQQFRACIVCFKRGEVAICSGCCCVAYCGEAHQAQDWPRHKVDCDFYKNAFHLRCNNEK